MAHIFVCVFSLSDTLCYNLELLLHLLRHWKRKSISVPFGLVNILMPVALVSNRDVFWTILLDCYKVVALMFQYQSPTTARTHAAKKAIMCVCKWPSSA